MLINKLEIKITASSTYELIYTFLQTKMTYTIPGSSQLSHLEYNIIHLPYEYGIIRTLTSIYSQYFI